MDQGPSPSAQPHSPAGCLPVLAYLLCVLPWLAVLVVMVMGVMGLQALLESGWFELGLGATLSLIAVVLVTWGLRGMTRSLAASRRWKRLGIGVLFFFVGLSGWGLWALVLVGIVGAGAIFSSATEPRIINDPSDCIVSEAESHLPQAAVAEWTECRGADESFMQGRLMYIEGRGRAVPETCTRFVQSSPPGAPPKKSEDCSLLETEGWTRGDCPAYAVPGSVHCFECEYMAPTVDSYRYHLGWSEDCSRVHVLLSTNVPLEDVSERALRGPDQR